MPADGRKGQNANSRGLQPTESARVLMPREEMAVQAASVRAYECCETCRGSRPSVLLDREAMAAHGRRGRRESKFTLPRFRAKGLAVKDYRSGFGPSGV